VEVRIPCADPPDSVLAHENRCVRVVKQIPCQVRKLHDDLPGYFGMSLCGDQDIEPGRGEQRHNELPCSRRAPWAPHHPGVSRHAQKFVQNCPGGIPGIRAPSLMLKPVVAGGVKGRVSVGGIYQNVGIYDEHYRPSMAW